MFTGARILQCTPGRPAPALLLQVHGAVFKHRAGCKLHPFGSMACSPLPCSKAFLEGAGASCAAQTGAGTSTETLTALLAHGAGGAARALFFTCSPVLGTNEQLWSPAGARHVVPSSCRCLG